LAYNANIRLDSKTTFKGSHAGERKTWCGLTKDDLLHCPIITGPQQRKNLFNYTKVCISRVSVMM
jgi:hypothetical protein